MPQITYCELTEKLKEKGIDVALSCCDPSTTAFSFLQVQIQGDIYFSTDGVFLKDEGHDAKCKMLLEKAVKQNIDLVLFPEYCISYELLDSIVLEKEMWPPAMKLWCLPCQGVSVDKFEIFLEQLRQNESVLLIDEAWSDFMNKKKFVNAFFYCFLINDNNKKRLCLVPQIKTQHMSDPFGECEAAGLTLGSMIFTINHRLITILCADAMNNEISWKGLQNEHSNSGLLLLHPQMNSDPKHFIFRRIRQEIQTHNHSAICISCNWASGTRLFQKEDSKFHSQIKLSWSCIYHKHQSFSKEEWEKKKKLLRENAKWGLLGSYMEKARMEVWYGDSGEHALLMILPNTASTQYAVTQFRGVKAEKRFCWSQQETLDTAEDADADRENGKGAWQDSQFVYSLANLMESPHNKEILGQAAQFTEILDERYHFPFCENDKYTVDTFFAITLPSIQDTAMTIDELEHLADWTLLLDDNERDQAIRSLLRLYELANFLQQKEIFPPRLSTLRDFHRFCLSNQDGSLYNINMGANHEMLIAYAHNDVEAQKIAKNLMKQNFSNDSYKAEHCLGVLYVDIISKTPRFLPEFSTNVDCGDHSIIEGDITNGGY